MIEKLTNKNYSNPIPSGWQEKPFWSIANQKSIKGQDNLQLLSIYLNKGVIKFADVKTKRTNVTSDDKSKYQRVDPGDFVMNNQQSWRGSVGVSQFTGIVSPAYLIFKISRELNPSYANYLLRDKSMVEKYLLSSRGVGSIQRNLHFPSLKTINVLIPPIKEQEIISQFLDKKTKQIDLMIEKIKNKIELLKEQKVAILYQLVTIGLDPNIELKDTGIDCIGEIPQHWKIKPIKYIAEITLGKMLTPNKKEDMIYRPYLRSLNVQENNLCLDDINYMWFFKKEIDKFSLRKNDILVNEGGEVGRPCFLEDDINETGFQNSINRIRVSTDYPKYIFLVVYLCFLRGYYDSIVNRVSIPHLTKEKLENCFILTPPLEEQKDISRKVNLQFKNLSKIIELEFKRISLLEESKLSLISSVVTGKIRITKDMI